MNNDHKDPNHFGNRLSTVEQQINLRNKEWKLMKLFLFVITALFLLLFSIGVVQFISGGS
ncbi:hypothetical protein [Paenibacillus taiwanensis]|uniref:hypothetical protein n=1 Tax=Paenibacillus taiwanensis TaxID=401638 RepID=UPI0003FA2E27|nr:hypothetical protein [Paenibacillus taiwanensis]